MSDPSMSSNDGHTSSDAQVEQEQGFNPAGDVAGILAFNLDTPEGERRMRECLDAPRWKAAVHEFDMWLLNQIKYSDHSQAWIDAYEQVRMDFFRIFDDRGIDLLED